MIRRSELSSNTITWSRHSRLMEQITRSTYARCQGERGVDTTSSIPMSRTCSREVLAVNRIAIPQQVAWELVKRESVPQLLAGPLGGWVLGNVKVEDATTIMGQDAGVISSLVSARVSAGDRQ